MVCSFFKKNSDRSFMCFQILNGLLYFTKFHIYVLADFKYVLDALQILNQVYYMLLSM
ncbi:unnamed protein product [Brassica oleracea]